MKDLPIKLGPLALLLTVISICMTVLGILTYTTSRADMKLAETYAETVRTRYRLETEAQEYLVRLSAPGEEALPDADGVIRETFRDESGLMLHTGVRLAADGDPVVVEWRFEHEWEEDTSITVWDGTFPG
ncbi:MAG: hypothetical protein II680_08405 [Clostridia bacterium]|nr:hypothetical protein [Clostridia bacterium]